MMLRRNRACSSAVQVPSDCDRNHVIVDRLGQPDDAECIAGATQKRGEVGGGAIGIVAANRVQDGHAVAFQLFGRDLERVLARLNQPALHAIGDVGEFDPAVSDRASTERVESMRYGADGGRGPRRCAVAAGEAIR